MKRTKKMIVQGLQQIADKLPKSYRRSAIYRRIVKLKLKQNGE